MSLIKRAKYFIWRFRFHIPFFLVQFHLRALIFMKNVFLLKIFQREYLLDPLWWLILSRNIVFKRRENLIIVFDFFAKRHTLIPDLQSLYIYAHVCLAHDYERLQKPKKGDVIFDVGAHVGFFTMECMRYKPSIIVAIEPHPLNVLFLNHNTIKNRIVNVMIINLAVGEKEEKSRLYLSKYSSGHSLEYMNECAWIEVNVTTIDNIVNNLKLAPDYLKIDVEGHEVEVLRGAKETLEKFKPTIIVETSIYKIPKIVCILKPYGYKLIWSPYGRGGIHVAALPG